MYKHENLFSNLIVAIDVKTIITEEHKAFCWCSMAITSTEPDGFFVYVREHGSVFFKLLRTRDVNINHFIIIGIITPGNITAPF